MRKRIFVFAILLFSIWIIAYALQPFGNHVATIIVREEKIERGVNIKKTFYERVFFHPYISALALRIKPVDCRMNIIYQEGLSLKRHGEEDSISASIYLYTVEKDRLDKSYNKMQAKKLVLDIIDKCMHYAAENNPERLAMSILSGEAEFVISVLEKIGEPNILYKTEGGEDIHPLEISSRLLSSEQQGTVAYESRLEVHETLTRMIATTRAR